VFYALFLTNCTDIIHKQILLISKMNLIYASLFVTVLTCFAFPKKNLLLSLCSISILTALFYGTIDYRGLFSLMGLYAITYFYFQPNNLGKNIKAFLGISILIITGFFLFHMVPGFKNDLVINQVAISPISIPFSMYLNFDTTIIAVILFINSNLYKSEKPFGRKSSLITLKLLFLCASTLMISGLLANYIQRDIKFSDVLGIWFINNLFFVCFAEEVVFRGIIQNKLNTLFTHRYIIIILSSLLFGLRHYKGGIIYILLSTVAGCFYGLAYQKTNRILCAMIVHFGLNFIHFIFFTYPALNKMIK
jgi:membrane protease YdiL (CAAX protease family)